MVVDQVHSSGWMRMHCPHDHGEMACGAPSHGDTTAEVAEPNDSISESEAEMAAFYAAYADNCISMAGEPAMLERDRMLRQAELEAAMEAITCCDRCGELPADCQCETDPIEARHLRDIMAE
jgi:hypothetical protein